MEESLQVKVLTHLRDQTQCVASLNELCQSEKLFFGVKSDLLSEELLWLRDSVESQASFPKVGANLLEVCDIAKGRL